MNENETNATRPPGPDTPFEIGLVMAGAISAGAYTAGVIDFLIEALDAWEDAKAYAREHTDDPKSRECPMHEVKIKVMAGASAGGMTAAIAAGMLGMKFESVIAQPDPDHPVKPVNNSLYRNWVNTIDIVPLLDTKDLDQDATVPVQSVLDSSILLDIANNAFRFERPDDRKVRPYVADPLHVLLTVTNLRGVPYAPTFENFTKAQQYEMMSHADNMHFIVSQNQPQAPGDAFWLQPYQFKDEASWGVLQTTALATGAFPVGLAPRLLKRLRSQYEQRQWVFPGPHEVNGVHFCEYWQAIPPFWAHGATSGGDKKDLTYEFLCVDGGVMNNEPLDLARHIMAGANGTDPIEGDKATRAVIMVLPFPNAAPEPARYDGRTDLVNLLITTFNSLINQARFKPAELALANNPDVYSRFLVVPRRGFRPDGMLEPYTIACGSLGGFGGFLSRKFREHDYQLGRRNCQWFLKQYFVLPNGAGKEKANKLFDRWTHEAREKHKLVKAGTASKDKPVVLPYFPIIPLVGKAAVDVPETRWPNLTSTEFAALRPRVKHRVDRVVKALIVQNVKGHTGDFFARLILRAGWWLKRRSVVDAVMKTIADDLSMRKLMEADR